MLPLECQRPDGDRKEIIGGADCWSQESVCASPLLAVNEPQRPARVWIRPWVHKLQGDRECAPRIATENVTQLEVAGAATVKLEGIVRLATLPWTSGETRSGAWRSDGP